MGRFFGVYKVVIYVQIYGNSYRDQYVAEPSNLAVDATEGGLTG